jgi:hypothetical protein
MRTAIMPMPMVVRRLGTSIGTHERVRLAFLAMLVALAPCSLAAASTSDNQPSREAIVQNVRTEQLGASAVRILYDLYSADPTAVVEVSADVSLDGGKTYGVTPKSVMGDVGRGVKPGLAKSILWDVRKDVGAFRFDLIKAKISVVPEGAPVSVPPPVTAAPVTTAPVAPPPPVKGTIVVTSRPSEATVTVDGTWRGVTPSEIKELPGAHRVIVTKSGYLENASAVNVRPGAVEVVDVNLTPQPPVVAPRPPERAAAKERIRFGPIGGLNVASLTLASQGVTISPSSRTGIAVGGFVEVPVASGMAFLAQALVAMKGATTSIPSEHVESDIKLTYVDIPLLFKYSISIPKSPVVPYVVAGPSVGLLMSASASVTDHGTTESQDVKNEMKSADFGLVIGAGLRFGKVFGEIRYSRGLTDILSVPDWAGDVGVTMKNSAVSVLFGGRF